MTILERLKRWWVTLDEPEVPASEVMESVVPVTICAEPQLHERYPDILQWKVGDEFRGGGGWYYFISLSQEGTVYAWDFLHEHKHTFSLGRFYNLSNLDLEDRRINKALQNSHAYMALISDFQKAVEELKRRDIEKLGEPIEDILTHDLAQV